MDATSNLSLNCENLARLDQGAPSPTPSTIDDVHDLLCSIESKLRALKHLGQAGKEVLRKSICFLQDDEVRCIDNDCKLNNVDFLKAQLDFLSGEHKNAYQTIVEQKLLYFDKVAQTTEDRHVEYANNFRRADVASWVQVTNKVPPTKNDSKRKRSEDASKSNTQNVATRRSPRHRPEPQTRRAPREGKPRHPRGNMPSLQNTGTKSSSMGSIIEDGVRKSARIAAKSSM
ncbi:hypothetical protein BGZ61DRAFT_485947 [Ilyonectria robusta]|uniref:uncharacterized protein n=1 Tax=Ilyonectria robusta TaxID=1079257 RepID=UPI001E8EB1C8|nr:uncharacterized protein BGZ61DRAFT_485947 [Ilyonectria robusta]KAH8659521.1 hypothetical protein BGZ61DRAFT_485947 [Ilyonectria robusta]